MNCGISDPHLEKLEISDKIEELDLSANQISNDGIETLLNHLDYEKKKNKLSLNLSANKLTSFNKLF